MSISRNKVFIILLSLTVSLITGVLSAFPMALVVVVGLVCYVTVVILFTNEVNIKKVIPVFLILTLFQDTISRNLSYYVPNLGNYFSNLDELFLITVVSALIINFFRGKRFKGISIILTLVFILFFGLVSSFIHSVPIGITFQGMFLLTKGLTYLFVFTNISFNEQDIKKYVSWIKVFSIIILVFACVDLLMHNQLRKLLHTEGLEDYRYGIVSLQSLFVHPGIYGWFMLVVGIYLAVAFKVKKNYKYLLLSCVFFSFALLSLRFKVMLSICIILFLLYLLKGLLKVLVLLVPFSVLLLLISLAFGNFITDLTSLTVNRYINVSMYESARKALYQVSVWIGQNEFPFGVGFGRYGGFIASSNYSPVYYEYGMNHIYGLTPDNPIWATDTYWPNIIGETGFISATILLGFFIYISMKLLRGYKKIEQSDVKIFVLFAGLVLIDAISESLGEPVFNSSPQYVFIFITLGIALSMLKTRKKTSCS